MSLTFALQSLLARHEAYVLDAEKERSKMAATINRLESDKRGLEADNAKRIEENRALLDHLEGLNNVITSSDAYISSLNATLQSTSKELDRLTVLASRATQLETQLSQMESEQIHLYDKLAEREEDNRSTMQRWKEAERLVSDLQDQVDRIEREAGDEREKHAELLSRYERRNVVDSELQHKIGLVQGGEAESAFGRQSEGNTNVVSHFVKDILADNASLQTGIMELREMLMGSNTEVQHLREQMLLHQAVPPMALEAHSRTSLEQDMEQHKASENQGVPALHVHHHYHGANKVEPPSRHRSATPRRTRRKHALVTSGASTPRGSPGVPHGKPTKDISSATAILSQTAASIPPRETHPHRLSMQSTQARSSIAASSVPSSPHPSLFDFITDSSRPTSPESLIPGSPLSVSHNRMGISKPRATFPCIASQIQPPKYSVMAASGVSRTSEPLNPMISPTLGQPDHDLILEVSEDDLDPFGKPSRAGDAIDNIYISNPQLRRSASHESVLSVTGLAPIKNKGLRQQQSQVFRGHGLKTRPSFGPSSPTTTLASSRLVVSPTVATTRATSLGAVSTLSTSLNQGSAAERGTLGKRVGGWVKGKWGMAPMASTGNLRAQAAVHSRDERPPGVNQKGPIPHLKSPKRLSIHVEPISVNEGLLQESLGEE
ncbi:MAG: hypothetical protein LQ342_000322 [Letrouitia transgressa]|nr:MAG: hypothetical protein LQ342_000322 [Letrouitia transgressa]